jgi:hypothetical protein
MGAVGPDPLLPKLGVLELRAIGLGAELAFPDFGIAKLERRIGPATLDLGHILFTAVGSFLRKGAAPTDNGR